MNLGLFRCPFSDAKLVLDDSKYPFYGYTHAQEYLEQELRNNGIPYQKQEISHAGLVFDNIIANFIHGKTKILFTAHYDTVFLCGGADDNASGVAVLLELLKRISVENTHVGVVFFTLEEATKDHFTDQQNAWIELLFRVKNDKDDSTKPSEVTRTQEPKKKSTFVQTEVLRRALVGSQAFVTNFKEQLSGLMGIINLESVGVFKTSENSQKYTFNDKVPSIGDFLALLTNKGSTALAYKLMEYKTEFLPLYTMWVEDDPEESIFYRSDHYPFWLNDIPAITLTDTLESRYEHYHSPLDLPEKLDFEKMAHLLQYLLELSKDISTDDTDV